MRDRMHSRNARRHARPGRGPFPVFTPGPTHHAEHSRHAFLCQRVVDGEAGLAELAELIDLRLRTGRVAAPRNAFGEVIGA